MKRALFIIPVLLIFIFWPREKSVDEQALIKRGGEIDEIGGKGKKAAGKSAKDQSLKNKKNKKRNKVSHRKKEGSWLLRGGESSSKKHFRKTGSSVLDGLERAEAKNSKQELLLDYQVERDIKRGRVAEDTDFEQELTDNTDV